MPSHLFLFFFPIYTCVETKYFKLSHLSIVACLDLHYAKDFITFQIHMVKLVFTMNGSDELCIFYPALTLDRTKSLETQIRFLISYPALTLDQTKSLDPNPVFN